MTTIDSLPEDPSVPSSFDAEPPVAVLPAPTPAEAMHKKLDESPVPLKLSELKKGISKPKKKSVEEFDAELLGQLEEKMRAGQAFSYPSGKNAEVRYWSKDEKHAIREEALNLAATGTLAELSKKLMPVSKANAVFIESILRDLIGEERLFEHPPKKPNGPAQFGTDRYESPNNSAAVTEALIAAAATPRPMNQIVKEVSAATRADKAFVEEVIKELVAASRLHEHPGKGQAKKFATEPVKRIHPLETAASMKALVKLSKDARKLLEKSSASLDELLQRLQTLLSVSAAMPETPAATSPILEQPAPPPAPQEPEPAAQQPAPQQPALQQPEKIEELILREVKSAPVLSLADLRRSLPADCRGPEFDAAAIRLFDQQKVVLFQDANPHRFTDAEKAEFVRDETGALFTSISTRS